ncbi:MAG: restriction endonuclease [Anaerolineae bacterium]|nr:restriction endonuclease [Anaerolineae bacterium]
MNYQIENLRPDEFEKLAFYLLDDMGFKNLEWRKGGEGVSATDGGRDLSGKYAKVEPDDSIVLENWWVEVKHRSNTLKKSTVQSIILNSAARKDVDVFAVFTNNVISNSTLDWIKEFQNTYPKPRVVVWQKHDLERILRKYPKTASLFFLGSLTLPEQLESIKQRFWNNLGYPTISEVELFWKNFSSLSWDGSELLPFILADYAMDGIYHRKWGFVIDEELLIKTLLVGLINVPFLVVRSEQQGQDQRPFMRGVEYLLQIALIRLDLNKVVDLLLNMYNYTEFSSPRPTELYNFILHPLISNIYSNLIRNCSKDCERYGINSSISDELGYSYFHKFVRNDEKENDDTEPFVLISLDTYKCKLDLVPVEVHCPISEDVPENIIEKPVLTRFLGIIQNVLQKRIAIVADSSK